MRDRSGWHGQLLKPLNDAWPTETARFRPGKLLDVELGLYLLETAMPGRVAADAWTLLGGYPFSEAFAETRNDADLLRIQRVRHYLWDMRRRREWHLAVETYMTVPEQLRGYDLKSVDSRPERRNPARAADRFDVYEDLLTSPPPFDQQALPVAGPGEYQFQVRDRRYSVTFTDDLIDGPPPRPHDLDALPPGRGAPVTVTWTELEHAAAEMDQIESRDSLPKLNLWAKRLARVKLLIRDEQREEFTPSATLRIDHLLNLVGMVGAGKSTLRDILAFWAASKTDRRITIIVGDVAESLTIVDQFARLGVTAAPVLGHSTRERNIERLHRRTATAGAASMLTHNHPGFAYLSSACPLDALRGLEAPRPLRISEAPCLSLYPVATNPARTTSAILDEDDNALHETAETKRPKRHACPLWTRCPRHHGARELVDARIWVATGQLGPQRHTAPPAR